MQSSLFRPYIKLDLQSAGLFPRDTCTVCANEISSIMNALRAMYGLRRVPLAVPSIILSASTIHLLNLPSEPAAAHLSQGMHDLQALSVNHQFAAKCVDIIRALATKWNITLPEGATSTSVFREHWQSPQSSAFFAASIERNESSESGTRSSEAGTGQGPFLPPDEPTTQHRQNQRQDQNPGFCGNNQTTPVDPSQSQMTFWTPFPVQGAPLQPQNWHAAGPHPFSSMDSEHQWPMFSDYSIPTTCSAGMPPMTAAMDEGIGGTMPDWTWR